MRMLVEIDHSGQEMVAGKRYSDMHVTPSVIVLQTTGKRREGGEGGGKGRGERKGGGGKG